jgi:nicotinamide phosphoribosyltransferase
MPGWMETKLMRLWYPITVATQSFFIKRKIMEALRQSANDPMGEIGFKLHDFGSRGVSSRESAGIGGMAHLVNFMGSDTCEGVGFANHYYNEKMAGFSIPAAEHSTITSWGKEHELDAFRNMLTQFGQPGKLVACVSDSYDLWKAIETYWCDELHEEVKASGATLVIRPDSGNPTEIILKVMQTLERKLGMSKNTKGYKLLPPYFRVIQGDGVNEDSIVDILSTIMAHGYSASNLAFGMGGALLQQVNRDTQRFAMKCSQITVNGETVDVWKDPVTDPGKTSKKGRLDLVMQDGKYRTIATSKLDGELNSQLELVYDHGMYLRDYTLANVRERANRWALEI